MRRRCGTISPTVEKRRAGGGADPHPGTRSPGGTRRTGTTAGSGRCAGPTHHAQGVVGGGSRGDGPVSERSHAGGHRRQLAGGVHETGHGVQGQDGGDVGGGRRVCPLPARRQQRCASATTARRGCTSTRSYGTRTTRCTCRCRRRCGGRPRH